jgi:hypothetical protein
VVRALRRSRFGYRKLRGEGDSMSTPIAAVVGPEFPLTRFSDASGKQAPWAGRKT